MTFLRYLVLLAIVVCSTIGDFLIKIGMNQVGDVTWSDPLLLLRALFNPWVFLGTLILIAFFIALTVALSWADLSYVMPATALGYVLTTILSAVWLHEYVSPHRWAGVVLITCAVAFVAQGKARTVPEGDQAR